ncbi:MAG: DUF624 domain-containing protein [Clostridiales bacterium]|nr:DUF624 domain-containing protein [Clostridiales bacterium]
MGLFGGYGNSGPGIPKSEQQKKGIFKFFEIFGRKFWKLIQLNLIYLLFCIPVVTFGPATASLVKITRNYTQERPIFLWSEFWKTFKSCFKQSFIMGLIDVIFTVALFIAIPAYNQMAKQNNVYYIPFVICLSFCFIFIMMHFYIYLMIVSTNLSLPKILKNSFILVAIGLKQSLQTLFAIFLVVFALFLFLPYSSFIMPFLPFSFIALIISFNCFPVIRKHVIQPFYAQQGEESPEFDFKKTDDNTLFEDKGGDEAPVKAIKKGKGKRIS